MSQNQSTNLADALQLYASMGYHLIPLRGKIPVTPSWPKTPFNPFPSVSDFPYGNFGVVLQDDDLVIDVDLRNYKNGVDSLKDLEIATETLLNDSTFTVLTGNNGLHYYFKKPAQLQLKGSLDKFPGIEFRSAGKQMVGAGSIHPDTKKSYEIICDKTPQELPYKFFDLLKKEKIEHETKETDQPSAIYKDDAQTIKRFREYCQRAQPGIEGDAGDKTTLQTAFMGHDYGLSAARCYEIMLEVYNPRCVPPWTPEDLQKKVNNAYKYATAAVGINAPENKFDTIPLEIKKEDWDKDQYGNFKKNSFRNCMNLLCGANEHLFGMLVFNEFSYDVVFKKPAPWHKSDEKIIVWDDQELLRLKNYLTFYHRFEPNTTVLQEAVMATAYNYKFHPVKNYLNGLKWDGVKRVHEWMVKFLGAEDNQYTRAVGMKTLLGGVARIFEPGCVFQYMLVLEGAQGIGKSRVIEALAAPWFLDQSFDIHNKDSIHITFGQWIIEVSEMETFHKSETAAMKAYIVRSTDRGRLSYARMAKDFKRQFILIGTYNPEKDADIGYFKDTTGNRRYWPVKVGLNGVLQVDNIRKVRDQLWAEAVLLYKKRIPLYLEDAQINKLAEEEQKKRLGVDAWHEKIRSWVGEHEIYKFRQVIKAEELYSDCLGGKINMLDRRISLRLSSIMYELGWEKGIFYSKDHKESVRGFRRPMIE